MEKYSYKYVGARGQSVHIIDNETKNEMYVWRGVKLLNKFYEDNQLLKSLLNEEQLREYNDIHHLKETLEILKQTIIYYEENKSQDSHLQKLYNKRARILNELQKKLVTMKKICVIY